ncbi:MAG: endonuclease III [Clostridia bacterium]|nr:endonuclease III [Clostridia bacterium]
MRVSKRAILAELQRVYPDAGPELNFTNPSETLVAVMLSAQCTDKQVNKVTPALFERYPDVEAMAAASVEDVYPMVKSCGFKTKASNIVEACRLILHRHGGQVPGTMEALTALPGVGQKTANVVLANAFGVPTIAVDTHVFRVSNRLGLAEAGNVEKTEEQLKKAIPKKDWVAAHHWLIFHGRRVCHSQRPACENCTLNAMCKAYDAAKKTGLPVPSPKAKKETKPAAAAANPSGKGKTGRKTAVAEA